MSLDRRTFLKLAGLTGVAVCSPFRAKARPGGPELYDGPLFLFVHAEGGWDQTMFVDPKGKTPGESDPVNHYLKKDIGQVGAFRIAPNLRDHRQFFVDHKDEMAVVHGYDVANLAHAAAQRYSWTGVLRPTHPSIGAVVAAAKHPNPPLAYLTNGGTTTTRGAVNQVRASELRTVREMNDYNVAKEVRGNPNYYDETEQKLLEEAVRARKERRMDDRQLPVDAREESRMQTVYTGHDLIEKKAAELPSASELRQTEEGLKRQCELVLASYEAGITISGTLSIRGFDSHTGNDGTQKQKLDELMEGLSYVMDEIQRRGIQDYYVVAMSDFGRSPGYNADNGKGHYPIASMMVLSPNIEGNRVIGATDANLEPKAIDPETHEVVEDPEDGVALRPEHVHASLRSMAGISSSEIAREKFALPVEQPIQPFFS